MAEIISNYTIEDINIIDILKNMYIGDYEIIREHIEDAEEIDESCNIIYVNGKNTADNVYTNIEKESPYKWIILKNNGKDVAIQLLKFITSDIIELIIAERSINAYQEEQTFKKIIDNIISKYNPKELRTFALTDRLKQHYINYGFKLDNKNQLILKV
jgi:hypothetical protein